MENKNQKVLPIVLMVIAVIFITAGLVLDNLSKESKEGNQSNKNDIVNVTKPDDEQIAKDILQQLNIDDFVAEYFTPTTQLNKNLLDISDSDGINKYFLANKNIEKYILVYENPQNLDMIYIKYSDYIEKSKEVFNTEPTYDYKNMTMKFPNLTKNAEGKYDTTLDNVEVCNLTGNVDNCYILIASGTLSMSKDAEFSSLKIKNNIITGDVKKYYDINDKDFYIDGKFEFEYEKKNNNYIVKSFKIIEIYEQ